MSAIAVLSPAAARTSAASRQASRFAQDFQAATICSRLTPPPEESRETRRKQEIQKTHEALWQRKKLVKRKTIVAMRKTVARLCNEIMKGQGPAVNDETVTRYMSQIDGISDEYRLLLKQALTILVLIEILIRRLIDEFMQGDRIGEKSLALEFDPDLILNHDLIVKQNPSLREKTKLRPWIDLRKVQIYSESHTQGGLQH